MPEFGHVGLGADGVSGGLGSSPGVQEYECELGGVLNGTDRDVRSTDLDLIRRDLTPPVSVCIPMYNNSATIERCLRSILDQGGVEFEIVVVDDDSSDESAAVAATMLRPGDRLIRNASRVGLSQNHNKCLEHARGRCIQFVHGDDWLLPGALQSLARCFDDPTCRNGFRAPACDE
jgi:cellulose synthase/poly-beta-1,6-N-acetylglucosamine synthase-like glycosyltransferase